MAELQVIITDTLAEAPAAEWNALVEPRGLPFLRHELLASLEEAGCTGPPAGWHARHILVRRGGRLVAAMPAYAKADSAGDFSRDWGLADLAQRAGARLYPKLVVGVPFTPATGQRILAAANENRDELVALLVAAARALCKEEDLATVQVLYCLPEEAAELERHGLKRRYVFQYHWENHAYRTVEDWLARLPSKKRTQIRRERSEPGKQGIRITTLRGEAMRDADHAALAREAHAFYRTTTDKYQWGYPYLNERFFALAFERVWDAAELVHAHLDGRLVAGAINFASPKRLFGRYWGCLEEHRFLHFNVALYHSVEDCIARGLEAFEAGAGGEHKLSRGFEPQFTHSAHAFLNPRLEEVMFRILEVETRQLEAELGRYQALHPADPS